MMMDITMLPEAQHINTSAGWKSLNKSTTHFLSKCERKNKRDAFGSHADLKGVYPVESRAGSAWAELQMCFIRADGGPSPLPSSFRNAVRQQRTGDHPDALSSLRNLK